MLLYFQDKYFLHSQVQRKLLEADTVVLHHASKKVPVHPNLSSATYKMNSLAV